MSEKYTFAILGGDRRQTVIAERLLLFGHAVRLYGAGDSGKRAIGAEICFSLKKAIGESDIVILPLPASRDGITLNMDSEDIKEKVSLKEIGDLCLKEKVGCIFGGMIPKAFYEYAKENKIECFDYYGEESLQMKNALPSAEGAIMLAMQNTDTVFEGSSVLVCGYGRIGRIIADKARKLGADVTVAARRDEVLCGIALSGYKALRIDSNSDMTDVVDSSDVIFNTVPSNVINKQILCQIRHTPLYIEIASSPGGIDISAAREKGMHILFAPSLPGKYAPVSAGEYIFETIVELLERRGTL